MVFREKKKKTVISPKRFSILIQKELKTKEKGIFKSGCNAVSRRNFVKTGYGCLLFFSRYRSFAESGNYKKREDNIFMTSLNVSGSGVRAEAQVQWSGS